jgi:diguanylate cyclase (GGDEF)-like protein
MEADDPNLRVDPLSMEASSYLSVADLSDRIAEEISRAERHGTRLSCLLMVIENLEEMAGEYGEELAEQTLEYVGGALRRELRRFDRIGRPAEKQLLILLPGASSPQGECVGRRVLERVGTIKVEARGSRRPLRISIGLAEWYKDTSAEDLLTRARAATHAGRTENGMTSSAAHEAR